MIATLVIGQFTLSFVKVPFDAESESLLTHKLEPHCLYEYPSDLSTSLHYLLESLLDK